MEVCHMLDELFGSRTRTRMLRLLLLEGGSYRLLELQRLVGTSISSVQKELAKLESIGLVKSSRQAGARFIEADSAHPTVEPLRQLLRTEQQNDQLALPVPESINVAIRPKLGAIAEACRRHGAQRAALVGSATEVDPEVNPQDLDVLVRFPDDPEHRAEQYFGLLEELERIMGMPVEIIEEDALSNPILQAEFERTQVVLYEAA
jgi:uncharacterized protein